MPWLFGGAPVIVRPAAVPGVRDRAEMSGRNRAARVVAMGLVFMRT